MQQKTELTIPCHWDKGVLDEIRALPETKGIRIASMYGSVPDNCLGSGRSPNSIANVSRDYAIEFRNYVRGKNLHFNYLLNNHANAINKDSVQSHNEYLDWLFNEFKPDTVVIASYELMKHIREKYGDIPIHISTIAGIANENDIEKYQDISPECIIPHHDVNRNFSDLERLVRKVSELGIRLELMLTESCLRRCPFRANHYMRTGSNNDDLEFHLACNSMKIARPAEILKANFIRPEDINFYENLGVNYFKVTGRSKKPAWLPEVVGAYLDRSYSGNLMRLLGIDPQLSAEDWIYVKNKSLEGFIQGFPKDGSASNESEYCNKWAAELYQNGDLKIDGFEHKITDKSLICSGGLQKMYDFYENLCKRKCAELPVGCGVRR